MVYLKTAPTLLYTDGIKADGAEVFSTIFLSVQGYIVLTLRMFKTFVWFFTSIIYEPDKLPL